MDGIGVLEALEDHHVAAQDRAVTARIAALEELSCLDELLVNQAQGVPELLERLQLVQMQVHGVRKAVVAEARVTGWSETEIAALLGLNVADVLSRFPS